MSRGGGADSAPALLELTLERWLIVISFIASFLVPFVRRWERDKTLNPNKVKIIIYLWVLISKLLHSYNYMVDDKMKHESFTYPFLPANFR